MKRKKLLFSFAAILLVIAAIPLTLLAMHQSTDSRSHAAAATTLAFSPSTISSYVSKDLSSEIMITPNENVITYVKVTLTYDPMKLAFSSFTPTAPFHTVQNPIAGDDGRVTIELAQTIDPNTMIKHTAPLGKITFHALTQTDGNDTQIGFDASTQVLSLRAEDGASENVLATVEPATIEIFQNTPEKITGNGLDGPMGIAQVGNEVWVSNYNTNTISRFHTDGTAIEPQISLGYVALPTGITMVGNEAWVLSSQTNSIVRFQPNGNRSGVDIAHVGNNSHGIAVVGDEVWVTKESFNTLVRLHFDGSPAGSDISGNGLQNPQGITIVGNQVWVTNINNTISVFTTTGTAVKILPLSQKTGINTIAKVGTQVWLGGNDRIIRLTQDGVSAGSDITQATPFGWDVNGIAVIGNEVWTISGSHSGNSVIVRYTFDGQLVSSPQPLLSITPSPDISLGDINADAIVDKNDLAIIIDCLDSLYPLSDQRSRYNTASCNTHPRKAFADLNHDGFINGFDYNNWLRNYYSPGK